MASTILGTAPQSSGVEFGIDPSSSLSPISERSVHGSLPPFLSAGPPIVDQAADASGQRVPAEPAADPELLGFVDIFAMPLPDEADLERRYKGMSAKELFIVHRCLLSVVNSEAGAFMKKKMERGLYTTQIVNAGTEVSLGPSTFPDGAIRSTHLVTTNLPDGSMEVKMAEIHPSEQPILAARHAEIDWLARRIEALGGTGPH